MNHLTIVLIFLLSIVSTAQTDSYKYVIVADQYEFQNEPNQYLLNDLAIFELKKLGYLAVKSTEIQPEDKNVGVCNTLNLKIDESGTLTRRFILHLEDCDGDAIMTSEEGIGRAKNNQKAYFQAMRKAMSTLPKSTYDYQPDLNKKFTKRLEESMIKSDQHPKTSNTTLPDIPSNTKQSTTVAIVAPVSPPADLKTDVPEVTELDYLETGSAGYGIQLVGSSIKIFNKNELVGIGRKSSSGVYVITRPFRGVGFYEKNLFVIEYDSNGSLLRLELEKVK